MLSLVALSLFNVSVSLAPIRFISALLELVPIPISARLTLLWAAIINVVVSVGYERWIAQAVADVVGMFVSSLRQDSSRRRIKDNRVYRAVDRD
jgi:cation-transporting P-type ATPase 13A2